MKTIQQLTLAAGLLTVSGLVAADIVNGPNPYGSGFGFDKPNEASWGEWTRGDAGTLYAEWDSFVDASYPGVRTAAPDVGSAGITGAYLGWNAGTFAAGSGNLYSFSVPEQFSASLTGSVAPGPVRAVLQFETWGIEADYSTITLNGIAPTFSDDSYFQANYASSFGPVDLVQHLAYWDLDAPVASYVFSFGSTEPSLSLAQVALDVGSITAVPVPAAMWMFIAGLMSMLGLNRRKHSNISMAI